MLLEILSLAGRGKVKKSYYRRGMSLAAEMRCSRDEGIVELYTVYFAPYPHTEIERTPETFGFQSTLTVWNGICIPCASPVVHTQIADIFHDS